MPKYYCDYCDKYLTHDSPSVRKSHTVGKQHKLAVQLYYQQFEAEFTQSLIEARLKEYEESKGRMGNQMNPYQPHMGYPNMPPGMQGPPQNMPPGMQGPPQNMPPGMQYHPHHPHQPNIPPPGMHYQSPPNMPPGMQYQSPPPNYIPPQHQQPPHHQQHQPPHHHQNNQNQLSIPGM